MQLSFVTEKDVGSPFHGCKVGEVKLQEDGLLPGRLPQQFNGYQSLVPATRGQVNFGIVLQQCLTCASVNFTSVREYAPYLNRLVSNSRIPA